MYFFKKNNDRTPKINSRAVSFSTSRLASCVIKAKGIFLHFFSEIKHLFDSFSIDAFFCHLFLQIETWLQAVFAPLPPSSSQVLLHEIRGPEKFPRRCRPVFFSPFFLLRSQCNFCETFYKITKAGNMTTIK